MWSYDLSKWVPFKEEVNTVKVSVRALTALEKPFVELTPEGTGPTLLMDLDDAEELATQIVDKIGDYYREQNTKKDAKPT
jgi:hypothetical protein